jgi:hypothetical protein
MDIEIALMELGKIIRKEVEAHIRSFDTWKSKCEHHLPSNTNETLPLCKHEKAYLKAPRSKYAWCDYDGCPVIGEGMKI